MHIAKCRLATGTARPGPNGTPTSYQFHPLPDNTLQAQGRRLQTATRKGLSQLSKLSTWCARPGSLQDVSIQYPQCSSISLGNCRFRHNLFSVWEKSNSYLTEGVPNLFIVACAQKERWGQDWFYLSDLSLKLKKITSICIQSLGYRVMFFLFSMPLKAND